MKQQTIITPRRSTWTWSLSVLAGAAGLALAYGFHQPIIEETTIRVVLLTALAFFVLSRLLMLVPRSALAARLRRWWVDYVLIIAAAVWWGLDHAKEPVILQVSAIYSIALGLWSLARAGICTLAEGTDHRPINSAIRRLLIGAVIIALVGGGLLSLPVCWEGPYPVETDHPPAVYHLSIHYLDCLFTAMAALTGTGLTCRDVGLEFSRIGLTVILALMQIGGLAILIIGVSAGWRLRRMIGWGSADDDFSPTGIYRLILFVCFMALIIEVAGTFALYNTWDPAADANFSAHSDRFFTSMFHAVSAFCNVGLTLPSNSLVEYRSCWAVYSVILPLMVIGSLGGPVVYDLYRRLTFRGGKGLLSLSKESGIILIATVILILVGTAGLFISESTTRYQLRYPREDTPGRLEVPTSEQSNDDAIIFSSENSARTRSQQMRTMPVNQRWLAALFHSITARSGGMRVARLDEQSISPAGRVLLMMCMLIGGGIGGTAGGLRIIILILLIKAVTGKNTNPLEQRPPTTRLQAVGIAAGVAMAMAALIILTTLALAYRESGSMESCAFEAVSACCNVGFSAGLTTQLSIQGRIVIVLAMLLGRIAPLAILLRCIPLVPARTSETKTEAEFAIDERLRPM